MPIHHIDSSKIQNFFQSFLMSTTSSLYEKFPVMKFKLTIQRWFPAALRLHLLLDHYYLITLFFQVSKSYLTSWLPQCSTFFFFACLFPRSSSSSKILLACFQVHSAQQSCLHSTPASLLIILCSFMPTLHAVATQDKVASFPSPSFPFLVTRVLASGLDSPRNSCFQIFRDLVANIMVIFLDLIP